MTDPIAQLAPAAIERGLKRVRPVVEAEAATCRAFAGFLSDESAGRVRARGGNDRAEVVVDRLMAARSPLARALTKAFGPDSVFPEYESFPVAARGVALRSDLNWYCEKRAYTQIRDRFLAARQPSKPSRLP